MYSRRNCCVVDTYYALALYLLYSSFDEIKDTVFFIGSTICKDVESQLPSVTRFDNKKHTEKISAIEFIKLRIEFLVRRMFQVRGRVMYGQDHLPYFELLLGRGHYVLLEDSPGVFSRCFSVNFLKPRIVPMGFREGLFHWLRYGTLFGRIMGMNDQCVNRIITDKCDISSDAISGRKYELVSLEDLWHKSSEEKKQYIKRVFGITATVLEESAGFASVFLTQPFREDCGLSDEEWVSVIRPILCDGKTMVKVHPRDKFDYKKYFPNVYILDVCAPMQLLVMLGLHFEKAITICSSSINAFPNSVEKVVIGTQVSPKIKAVYG